MKNKLSISDNHVDQKKIGLGGKYHQGKVEEFHENGIGFLKNSCYQTSMHIEGGSSGGPAINEEGKIFAINSVGCDVAAELCPYSFLTPIEYCLDIIIDTEDKKKISLRQIAEYGFLKIEE